MTDIAQTTRVETALASHPRRRIRIGVIFDHIILIIGALIMMVPLLMVLQMTTVSDVEILKHGPSLSIGDEFDSNLNKALFGASGFAGENTGLSMFKNSLILGVGFALGKIIISMMAAYAIVYFRLRFATLAFWPDLHHASVAARGAHSAVLRDRPATGGGGGGGGGLLNTYTGLILPLIASATATFFFRQFFLSVPEELAEAARIDGAGPLKFFIDILVPLSRTMIAAIFIIMFVYGWNQYLWPTMITTDENMFTLLRGIKQITQTMYDGQIPEYGRGNLLAILAVIPPVAVVIFFQSWFVKGLTESDK